MRRALLLAVLALALVTADAVLAAEGGGDKKDGQKAPEHKITQSKSYLSIDPFYTTIVSDNRPSGMLMVGVGLDVPDEAMRAEVTRSMPVLRDAYMRTLMAFTTTHVRTTAQPDVAAIADRLQAVTDRALKHHGARVLLAQVALRVTAK